MWTPTRCYHNLRSRDAIDVLDSGPLSLVLRPTDSCLCRLRDPRTIWTGALDVVCKGGCLAPGKQSASDIMQVSEN